jgi:hypothetical protein
VTIQQLDRLITSTQLDPVSKSLLRRVRKSVQSGTVGDAVVGKARWSVSIESEAGQPIKMNFSFRRIDD